MSEETKVEVSAEMEKFISYIENMTVLDLSKLVKALEERLGVSAAAPVAVAAVARLFGYGLCYGNLLHSGVPLHCRRCLSDCHHQRQPVHGCFGEDGRSSEFFY